MLVLILLFGQKQFGNALIKALDALKKIDIRGPTGCKHTQKVVETDFFILTSCTYCLFFGTGTRILSRPLPCRKPSTLEVSLKPFSIDRSRLLFKVASPWGGDLPTLGQPPPKELWGFPVPVFDSPVVPPQGRECFGVGTPPQNIPEPAVGLLSV